MRTRTTLLATFLVLFSFPAPAFAFAATFFDIGQSRSADGSSIRWEATFSLQLDPDQGGTPSTRVTVTSPAGTTYSGALVGSVFDAPVISDQPTLAGVQAALGDGTWRVEVDLDGNGNADGVYEFSFSSSALNASEWHPVPNVTSPVAGETVATSTPVFEWSMGPLVTTGDFNNVFADLYAADGNDQFGSNLPFFNPDVLMDFELDRAITFPGELAPGATTFEIFYLSQWLNHPGAGVVTKISGVDIDWRNFGQSEPKPTLFLGSFHSVPFTVMGAPDLDTPAGASVAITELLQGQGYGENLIGFVTFGLEAAQRSYDRYETALSLDRPRLARFWLRNAQIQVGWAILNTEFLEWVGAFPSTTADTVVNLLLDLQDNLSDLRDELR